MLFFRYDPQFFKYSLGLCSTGGVTSCAQGSAGTAHTLPHLLRQTLQGFLLQFRRHPIKGFGNAAGNAGKGVAVTAEGNSIAQGILKAGAFQKGDDFNIYSSFIFV